MMNEKEFIESQKECASMLGMSLKEYEEYCKNLKVETEISKKEHLEDKTFEMLKYFGIKENKLKRRKEK